MTTEAIINIRHSAKEIHGDPLAKALSQWENSIRKYKSPETQKLRLVYFEILGLERLRR